MRIASQVNGTKKEGPLQAKGQPGKSPERIQPRPSRKFLWNISADSGLGEQWCGEGRSWSWGRWGWRKSTSLSCFIPRTTGSHRHNLICTFRNRQSTNYQNSRSSRCYSDMSCDPKWRRHKHQKVQASTHWHECLRWTSVFSEAPATKNGSRLLRLIYTRRHGKQVPQTAQFPCSIMLGIGCYYQFSWMYSNLNISGIF